MIAQIKISSKLYRLHALFVIESDVNVLRLANRAIKVHRNFPTLGINFRDKFPHLVRKNYSWGTASSFIGHLFPPPPGKITSQRPNHNNEIKL